MKILSIRQPWAWLIVHGYKDVENRTWRTKYRGELYIHAGKSWGIEGGIYGGLAIEQLLRRYDIPLPQNYSDYRYWLTLPRGGIVGKVTLTDCVFDSTSQWAMFGQWHWIFTYPQRVPFFPCKGKLGIWEYEE